MDIFVLEDEIPAYQKLMGLINKEIPNSRIIGWARSVQEAAAFLTNPEQDSPDLIFSDIELLDGISFQVFEKNEVNCPIIFCTGFDQYLLRAFRTNGIAYLLKPYSTEDFREALNKYQLFFDKTITPALDEALLSRLQQILQQDKQSFKQRYTAKKKEGIKIVEVDNVVFFEAYGDFSFAMDQKGGKHLLNVSLANIERQVDPHQFFRVNRSQMVNIHFIEKVEPHFKNKLLLSLRPIKDTLLTSSNKTPAFRKWLEA